MASKLKLRQVSPILKEISFVWDGGGSTPTTGLSKTFRPVGFKGTIKGWYIVGDPNGSCVVEVLKAAGAKPTLSDGISGTEKPTLSAAGYNSDVALSTWTSIACNVGDVFGADLESVTTCTNIIVVIVIELID